MAVIEEYNEEAERANEEKKRAQERRKEAAECGSNLGPKGPSLEKAKPTGFARGFLDSEKAKGGLAPEMDQAAEAVQSKGSISADQGLSEDTTKEGTKSAGQSRETPGMASNEQGQNAAATSSSADREDTGAAATEDQTKSAAVKGTTPKGFAKGFLKPQAKQVTSGMGVESKHGDMSIPDTSPKADASTAGEAEADKSRNEPGGATQSASGKSDIAAHIERETEKDLPREPESGPSVAVRAEDTGSTESQPSETAKSELQEEAPGSAPQGPKEHEAPVSSESVTEQQNRGNQEGDAKGQSNAAPETASTPAPEESKEQGDEESAPADSPEEEDEFHDACEDEEQQRQQALARAEEARLRGNALYAAGDSQGALQVYSQALELAPPAFTPVEKVKDERELSEDADRQEGTSENGVAGTEAGADGMSDAAKRSDNGEPESNVESGDSRPKAKGPRRMRPPKVLDPKTGKLVVPDQEEEANTSGGAEPGAKEGGKREEEVPDQEAIDCRAACHANRAACFVQLELHDAVVRECNAALKLKPDYVKVLVRRAQASDKLDKQEEALADWKSVLEKDPSHRQARTEVRRLEPIVNEKREQMKEEMLGKLKDLGNSVLGHFGLSVDNFKAVKDPNTGGYSINFSK